jgi:prophage antirepressor-like protein
VKIRTAGTMDEPLFCLADVCAVLEIGNPSQVASRMDADEKTTLTLNEGAGGPPRVFINESGLYTILLRSDKPQARPFRKWITKEVIPSIMRHGRYPAPASGESRMSKTMALMQLVQRIYDQEVAILELADKQASLEEKIDDVEHLAQAAMDTQTSNFGYYSALAFLKVNGYEVSLNDAKRLGIRASRMCRQRDIRINQVRDPRFGLVNTYPEGLLEEAWSSLQN